MVARHLPAAPSGGGPRPEAEWLALAIGPLRPAASQGRARGELLGSEWLTAARGCWACIRVIGAESVASTKLLVRGTLGQWPDVLVDLKDTGTSASAWVFIGEYVTGLELDVGMTAITALRHVQLQVAAELSADTPVAVEMLTAAALHRIRARSVREVELTADAQWPLRAMGNEPQLRFRRLDAQGRIDMQAEIAAEAAAAPVLYRTDGAHRFQPQSSQPCTAVAEVRADADAQRYVAQLPALRSGAYWRLDPLKAPGRFRVNVVRLLAVENVHALLRPLLRCL
ncbi:MAG TPA: hypothetical protein VFP68_12560, partial [Burkholderiaceae bacterium]|nr:hypothetical protein [Burkholderiaceae bacterium]